jgi:hypothetical protein
MAKVLKATKDVFQIPSHCEQECKKKYELSIHTSYKNNVTTQVMVNA